MSPNTTPSAPTSRAVLALAWEWGVGNSGGEVDGLVLSEAIRSNAAQGWRRRDGLRPRLWPVNAPIGVPLRRKRLTWRRPGGGLGRMAALPALHADVSDPRLYREDTWREHFALLRDQNPVHRHAESPYGPYWSVTRYADIMTVELDHATYSSASELGGIQIADQPKGHELPNFIRMDPPRHTAQRKTVAPIVAPSNLANMEGVIRERTASVLDGLPRHQPFDWVDRVSTELTAMMLATLFDFPWEDRRQLTHWSDVAIANIEAEDAVVKSE